MQFKIQVWVQDREETRQNLPVQIQQKKLQKKV